MTDRIEPGTELPWDLVDGQIQTPKPSLRILVALKGMCVGGDCSRAITKEDAAQNLRYAHHTANTHPLLVEALERILSDEDVALSRPDFEFAHKALKAARGEQD